MKARNKQAVFFTSVLMLFMLMPQAGDRHSSQTFADEVGVFPPPSPGERKVTANQPSNPFLQLAPGVLTRILYQTASGAGYRVEVRDLLVGPGQHTAEASLPGAAVFEVRSGSGVVTVSGKRQEMKSGSTFALAEGQTFAIENPADVPISARVHLFLAI